MAATEWNIKGRHLGVCNCAWGCPCDFNALPTYGACEAVDVLAIDEGYYGDLRLDGLRAAALCRWPGPLHEGKGVAQTVIDEEASEQQREALLTIMSGEDQDEGTLFRILAATIESEHDTLYLPISFEFDMDGRNGRASASGVFQVESAPIRNPVTNDLHRAQIVLPDGFEYITAEIASATAKVTAGLSFDFAERHAALSTFEFNRHGLVK